MAEFDRPYTTSYQSTIVSIAIYSSTIFELFDVENVVMILRGSLQIIENI